MAGGRPTKYSPALAEKICRSISTSSVGLKTLCERDPNLPDHSTIYDWIARHKEFADFYARAREAQAQILADEITEIADDGRNDWMTLNVGGKSVKAVNKEVVQRSQLRVDARKWLLSKLQPKKYGDRLDMNVSGMEGLAEAIARGRERAGLTEK